jgi:hypothetical protein
VETTPIYHEPPRTNEVVRVLRTIHLNGRPTKPGSLIFVNSAEVERLCTGVDPAAERVE